MIQYLLLLHVEYHSLFYDITWYILFSILSWPMISTQYPCFVLTPTFMFFFLLFVECSKRAIVLNSTVIQASLTTSEIQGELMLLAWTGSSSSSLDALNFWHGLASYVFLAFEILLVQSFDHRCSCGDDFQILGIIIVIDFINEFKSSALLYVDITLKC